MDMSALASFLVLLVLSVFLMLAFREVVLWYWKVNRILETLQKIEQNSARVAMILNEVHSNTVADADKRA